jgi:tetratricopeptide (TPR) repeat protein
MEFPMSRRASLFAVVVGMLLGISSLRAEDKTTPVGEMVCLTCREADRIDGREYPTPLLVRELVRQAFLMAARDECGLFTRDASLREEFPPVSDSRRAPFDMYSHTAMPKKGVDYCYALGRAPEKTPGKLWTWKYHVDLPVVLTTVKTPESITKLAEQAEALSRGPFKELLKHEGWGKPVQAARSSAAVPPGAEDASWTWNEIGLLGGLRSIHAEIREKGESPELLAALSVGYANLGMVTEYYFNAAPKAYSARGLLYAERLVRQTGHSPWSLWHRAYVRAIVGLHHLAEVDLTAAKEQQDKPKSARPLPFWTGVLENFLQGKLARMLKEAKSPPERRLARYLNFEAGMWVNTNDLRIKAGQSLVEECPDCFRALDGMCSTYAIAVMRGVTERTFDLMSETLVKRMPALPGLPQKLAQQIRDHKPQTERSDEIEFRVEFISDIKQAAKTGDDKMEPSLAAVGQTIEEMEFNQVMRRLELERFIWGIRADATISALRPLCERHPYGGFVDLFGTSPLDILKGVATLGPRIDSAELTCMHAGPFRLGQNYAPTKINHWFQVIYCHADPVLRDEILGLQEGAAGRLDQPQYNDPYMKMLADTSSKFPAAVAAQITRNWKQIKSRSAELEKEFADDPVVLTALMFKYKELKQYGDAARCAKQKIHLAADYSAYRTLAAIYKEQGDRVRWKETLEESLSLPSLGLEEFQVRNQIARYYMGRKEWKEALPYADGAAVSYAGWALETSARCHEMLGDWKMSERLMRAISERYENSAFDWMVWCHRTGHGDARAAADLARKHFESLGASANSTQLESIGAFYLFESEPEKALAVFEKAYDRSKNVYDAMQAAIIADTLGKAEERDKNLARLLMAGLRAGPKNVVGVYSRLAALMKSCLPPSSIKDFDYKNLDIVLEDARQGVRRTDTNLKYFVGVFLKNRGAAEKARHYLIRSAQTAQYTWQTQALACQQLREMKVPFVPLGDENSTADPAAEP